MIYTSNWPIAKGSHLETGGSRCQADQSEARKLVTTNHSAHYALGVVGVQWTQTAQVNQVVGLAHKILS